MMNLLYLLASAIATEEGYWTLNSLPSRNHNPGDLRAAPWLPEREIKNDFVLFASPSEGIAGLYHQIALNIARGETLRQMITKWAPPNENSTEDYLHSVVRRTNLNPDIPLWQYLEIDRMS